MVTTAWPEGLCRRYEGMRELRGIIVHFFEKAGNYRFSSLIQAALSNIERYCKHSSANALLPSVLDKSRKSVEFSRNTNEINQSNAKTDAPKTVSCLKWSKQGPVLSKNPSVLFTRNWGSKTAVLLRHWPTSQIETILRIVREGTYARTAFTFQWFGLLRGCKNPQINCLILLNQSANKCFLHKIAHAYLTKHFSHD